MRVTAISVSVGLLFAGVARAGIVGTPVIGSTFDVRITQGATSIVDGTFAVPVGFRADGYKAITLGSLDANNDIVLKIHVETPNETESIVHYYVRTVDPNVAVDPAKSLDPFGNPIDPIEYWDNAGTRPVLDPTVPGEINVQITGLQFSGPDPYTTVIPLTNDSFATMYMFNPYGQYFEMPGTVLTPVGYAPPRNQPARLTSQVSAYRFQDVTPDPPGDTWDHEFVGASGPTVSTQYNHMNNPAFRNNDADPLNDYTVFDPFWAGGTGGLADGFSPVFNLPFATGHVTEIGLAHIVHAPEPATGAAVLVGMLIWPRRRRRQS